MPFVSAKHRFVYIAIPKTGSSTMIPYLKDHYGAVGQGEHHAASCSVPDGYLSWTVVRNPWLRLLSWWDAWTFGYTGDPHPPKDRPNHTCSFAEFVGFLVDNREGEDLPATARSLRYPQHLYVEQQPCTRVLKLENIDEEFASLPFARPVPFGERRNAGKWRDRGAPEYFYRMPGVAGALARYDIVGECEALGYPVGIPA